MRALFSFMKKFFIKALIFSFVISEGVKIFFQKIQRNFRSLGRFFPMYEVRGCFSERRETMPRLLKKAKLEWSLYIDPITGRRRYNELCRRCRCDCMQSYKTKIVECSHYKSKRSASPSDAL